jgi:hypothetical protein
MLDIQHTQIRHYSRRARERESKRKREKYGKKKKTRERKKEKKRKGSRVDGRRTRVGEG